MLANVVSGEGNYGCNAESGEYCDMVELGILDPTKVVSSARQNTASVAGLLITTECMVAEFPQDDATGGAPEMAGMVGKM